MNVFKSYTLKWWQGSVFKVSVLSLGLIIGASWPEILAPWRALFAILFLVSSAYISYVWWKQ